MKYAPLVLALCATVSARAQPAAPEPYRPGLGDLMTMTVQPRHIKLGLAGREKNWAYAAYELSELNEALERVAKVRPRWRDFAVAETLHSLTRDPLAALSTAVKAGDGAGFAQAYARLTEACNLCHQSAGQGVIVIRVPETSPYPDQSFAPHPK